MKTRMRFAKTANSIKFIGHLRLHAFFSESDCDVQNWMLRIQRGTVRTS